MKARLLVLSVCAVIFSFALLPKNADACGHDGFFIGGGYEQLFMYTPDDQLRGAGQLVSSQIVFSPGFGAHFLLGYDFKGSRWGIQMPFGYSRFKLNRSEWVNYFDTSVEGILHLASWENGIDVSLIGGAGVSILPEGPIENNTGSFGLNVGIGPAFNWFFHRGQKVTSSVYVQVPVRMVIFFGNNLSANQTTVLQIPVRVGVSLGF